MLSNFFYVFKYLLLSLLVGAVMVLLGMKLSLGNIGLYIQPLLVGVGSAIIVFGILRQIAILKEDGFFDNISKRSLFTKKSSKSKKTKVLKKEVSAKK